jgi:GT2 family glycosyltransferase
VEQVLGVTDDPPDTAGISIVIVSFNTRDLLYRCLAALHDQELKEVHTIVVDNGSTDGSPRMVAERFPNVELVKLSDNIGFGPANNIGFERCRGEFILLLNSDAFLHPRALVNLVSAARRRPHAAVIGPRLLNPDGSLQRSAWPFPDPVRLLVEAVGLHRLLRRTRFYEDLGIWDHGQEREVDFVSGACLLLRALALKEVGGFDERFYMYAEESDMQQRLRARGWSVILAPTAAVTHVGGGSATGATSRLIQFYAGQIRFLRKHRGDGAAACGWLALLIGSVLRRRWVAARLALSLRLWREAR